MKMTFTNCIGWGIVTIIGGFMLLVLLSFLDAWMFELPFYLVAGWFIYLGRTLKEIMWNWEAIVSGIVFLVLSVGGFHLVTRSIVASRGTTWQWRWSICISALFLVIFGVSLAIGGIAHQAVWLARADKWISGRSSGTITKQIANARQLTIAVRLYAADEGGRYPARLDELITSGSVGGLDFLEQTLFSWPPGEPPSSWIYVRGLSESAPAYLPIFISPGTFQDGKRIIATNDTSVELMKPSTIRELMPQWKTDYAALGVPLPQVLQEYDGAPP